MRAIPCALQQCPPCPKKRGARRTALDFQTACAAMMTLCGEGSVSWIYRPFCQPRSTAHAGSCFADTFNLVAFVVQTARALERRADPRAFSWHESRTNYRCLICRAGTAFSWRDFGLVVRAGSRGPLNTRRISAVLLIGVVHVWGPGFYPGARHRSDRDRLTSCRHSKIGILGGALPASPVSQSP